MVLNWSFSEFEDAASGWIMFCYAMFWLRYRKISSCLNVYRIQEVFESTHVWISTVYTVRSVWSREESAHTYISLGYVTLKSIRLYFTRAWLWDQIIHTHERTIMKRNHWSLWFAAEDPIWHGPQSYCWIREAANGHHASSIAYHARTHEHKSQHPEAGRERNTPIPSTLPVDARGSTHIWRHDS